MLEETIFHWQPLSKHANDANISYDSDDDVEFSEDSLGDILEDLDVSVECLSNLTPAIDCPAKDCEIPEEPLTVISGPSLGAHDSFAKYIGHKFREADSKVVESLAKKSLQEYLRLFRERQLNTIRDDSEILLLDGQTIVTSSEFRDSGLGSSIHPSSSHASTIGSVSSGGGTARTQIPPLTEAAKKAEPFECTACGKRVIATSTRRWRDHLIRDLQPYACIFPGCKFSVPDPNILDLNVWTNHLMHSHAGMTDQGCPVCQKAVGSKQAFAKHMARHLEDIAFAFLPQSHDFQQEIESGSSLSLPSVSRDMALPILRVVGTHPAKLRKAEEETAQRKREVELAEREISATLQSKRSRSTEFVQPTYPKVRKDYLDIDTLIYYNLPFEYDVVRLSFGIPVSYALLNRKITN